MLIKVDVPIPLYVNSEHITLLGTVYEYPYGLPAVAHAVAYLNSNSGYSVVRMGPDHEDIEDARVDVDALANVLGGSMDLTSIIAFPE
jgi:hypothetical protein